MKDELNALKDILKLALKTKSIRIYKDGRIIVNFNYRPLQMPAKFTLLQKLQSEVLKTIRNITELEYRVVVVKTEPGSSYSTYMRVLENSIVSIATIKHLMRYFVKNAKGVFIRSSYAKVTFVFTPSSAEAFADFVMNPSVLDGSKRNFKKTLALISE
jgi:hypothetical protein